MDRFHDGEAPFHNRNGRAAHDLHLARTASSLAEEESPLEDGNRSRSPSPTPSPSSSPSPSPSSPSAHRALLDKPLEDLTEEDIMQLTREDCRRYLKEKGMRKPSWNKSQVIQQVISLKGLFDDCKDENETGVKKLLKESAINLECPILKPISTFTQMNGIGQETCVNLTVITDKHGWNDPQSALNHQAASSQASERVLRNLTYPQNNTIRVAEEYEKNHVYSRNSCTQCARMSARSPSPQLTIFYSGSVNVYDNIPADKAKAIMLLAASGDCGIHTPCLHNSNKDNIKMMSDASTLNSSFVGSDFQISKRSHNPLLNPSQGLRAINSEQPPLSREASVQRYLEKRRERHHRLRAP